MSIRALSTRYVPAVLFVGAVSLSTPWRYIMSRCLNQFGQEYDIDSSTVRSLFVDVSVTEFDAVKNHPHGAAAADRSMGSFFIEKFGREIGRDVWFFQCSKSDLRNGRSGSREWFWAKDAQVKPSLFKPADGDLQAMIDVDQYVDMPSFLIENFRPTLLYTFQPSVVAADRGEYSYTFTANNEAVYRVGGGAEYKHQVWNYDTDVLVFSSMFSGKSWFNWRNWIPFVTVAYQVDKKQMDDDHQIVSLIPIKRWFGPFALIARLLNGNPLRRFQLAQDGFLRLTTHKVDGVYTSTGRVNTLLCGEIKSIEDSALASMARTVKSGLTMAHVKKYMGDDIGATIVYEYHAQRLPEVAVVSYSGVPKSFVRGYQYHPNEYDSDAKQSLVSFMSPLCDDGFCPDLTTANAKQAIAGRITKVKSSSHPNAMLVRCVSEFVERVYKHAGVDKGTMYPVEPEVVYERQNRPTQRRILDQAEHIKGNSEGRSFLKREAYGKIADPRIITTINGSDKYRYSRYIYAFSDQVLKKQEWYAFGKVPFEVAVRVAEICSRAEKISNTDFSRFDGTISEVPRMLERLMIVYGFRKEFTGDLIELTRSQQNMTCYLGVPGDSVMYQSGLARASGSPETAAFNSIVNAFCAFLAWRMTREGGSFVTPDEAFARLGVYGGDDGLSPDLSPKTYVKASSRLGLTLDIEPIYRGKHGVKFLNRIYGPNVWYGDLTSYSDVKRAISKFHLTVSMPSNISNIEKLRDKAYAYYLSDSKTPILGDFVTAVVDRMPDSYKFRNLNQHWNAQYAEEVQYPNYEIVGTTHVTPDWMFESLAPLLEVFRIDILKAWIMVAPAELTYFLSPPNNMIERTEPVTTVPVVLEGDIVSREPDEEIKNPGKKPRPNPVRRGGKRRRIPRPDKDRKGKN